MDLSLMMTCDNLCQNRRWSKSNSIRMPIASAHLFPQDLPAVLKLVKLVTLKCLNDFE